ncbi:MAG: S46 family peptidase, partial [Thermoanaerobaculaceae bacterium]|nr:S46 family peptidase [Thermoanaerobaculaceae bacterium]
LVGRKRAEEARLAAWITAEPDRQARYGGAIGALETALAATRATREREMVLSFLPKPGSSGRDSRSSSVLSSALTLVRWAQERARPDMDREQGFQARDERSIRQRLTTMQQNLDVATEKASLAYFLRHAQALPPGQGIAALDRALAATGKEGDEAIAALLTRLFTGTRLTDQAVRVGALDLEAAALTARKDPMLDLAADLLVNLKASEDARRRLEGEMLVAGAAYMEALAAFRGTALYPDANSTLRFTYATIKGYNPRDGVSYRPFTTLRGVLEKNTGEVPFACPASLVLAAQQAEPGRYLDPSLGSVPVNFLSTNDITGGNSGSPIMNGRGELIGLAFDGNYESMTSDYQFEQDMSRTINVDVRYMLWVMEHVDGAVNLLREMGVASGTH